MRWWRRKKSGKEQVNDFEIGKRVAEKEDIVERAKTLIKTSDCATLKFFDTLIEMTLMGEEVIINTKASNRRVELKILFANFDQAHSYFWELVTKHNMDVKVE